MATAQRAAMPTNVVSSTILPILPVRVFRKCFSLQEFAHPPANPSLSFSFSSIVRTTSYRPRSRKQRHRPNIKIELIERRKKKKEKMVDALNRVENSAKPLGAFQNGDYWEGSV